MMMMSRRVCLNHGGKVGEEKKKVMMKTWAFKGFFKFIGEKVSRAMPAAAGRRRRCSCKVSSSASLGRCRSYAETLDDSRRAEAIEDCIEFFNSSSSSLQRSNSVSSSC
ncbi:uncharacterized protein LOC121804427 [Salvia splendens]|uniref:uncharacterized protein LOC121804427 n=1 Tax=Salvia splendens TaxID=180675 RepID=UPI001C27F06D|nr:uncharacterized protein LOC121804427 [Salvia splendens]